MASFSDKVREHRGILGLTQKQLSEKANISFRSIVAYEIGESFPYPAQLYKLAKALGVSTEYLKKDDVNDPAYGIERMDYVEKVRCMEGTKAAMDLEAMLAANQAIFADGEVSLEAKEAYFEAVVRAYLDCKEASRQTFGRKK